MTSTRYEITVEGHLDRGRWSRWFEGMDVGFREDGNTTISGPVVDQAVLHGVLARVRDLGIVLSFVQRAEEARPTQSTSE